ncbi:MAG: hypothetical protein H6741_13200 [Alphaproteobacteria bacterium]|nr:hypothetical protein [Alphaproteobacteria bacterium]MCB9793673.1 hypothetical protein [Alphaproteobacteria bacterium]
MSFFRLTAHPGASVSSLPSSSDRDLEAMDKAWDPSTRVRCTAPAPLPDLLGSSGRLLASPALAALVPDSAAFHHPVTVEDRDGGEHAYVFLKPSSAVNAIDWRASDITWRGGRKMTVVEAARDLVPWPDNTFGLPVFEIARFPSVVWVSGALVDAIAEAGLTGAVATPVEEVVYVAPPKAADHKKRISAWKKAAKAAGTEAGRTAADPPGSEHLADYIDGAWHRLGIPAMEAAGCEDGLDAFEAYDAFASAMRRALKR